MQIAEPLTDRSTWSTTGRCPIERAMAVVGSRAAMLVLREAYYGTSRFDEFVDRVDVAPATAAAHLRSLTDAGLLARRPYRPAEGGRTRDEYVLTEAGSELFPIIVGLFEWGRRHTDATTVLELVHAGCDGPLMASVTCSHGHLVTADETVLRPVLDRKRRHESRPQPAAAAPLPPDDSPEHAHRTPGPRGNPQTRQRPIAPRSST